MSVSLHVIKILSMLISGGNRWEYINLYGCCCVLIENRDANAMHMHAVAINVLGIR